MAIKQLAVLFTLLLCSCQYGNSNTVNSDGSQSGVQSAINSAHDGDTVVVPKGTFTWSGPITISKSITLAGSSYTPSTHTGGGTGVGAPTLGTIIKFTGGRSNGCIKASTGSTGNVLRITGLSFTGYASNHNEHIDMSSSPGKDSYRIDNCVFDGGGDQVVLLNIYGNGKGLIDHCTFSGGAASELVHDMGLGPQDLSSWQNDVTPGNDKMTYIEDNLFQVHNYQDSGLYQYSTSAFQTYYGARVAARYNYMRFVKGDTHGNNNIGGRWTEFYNNTFWTSPGQLGQSWVYDLRGGSGVFFDNVISKDCNPEYDPVIRVYTDQTSSNNTNPHVGGPQPAYGPGAGILQGTNSQGPDSSPVYFWGNDSRMHVVTDTGVGNWNPMQEGKNFFVSSTQPASMKISQTTAQIGGATYSYAPYTYPHPLIAQTQGGNPHPTPTPTPQPTPSPTPVPTPTPTPQPTPTPPLPTPSPSPSGAKYSNWLDQLSDWIRQHPAKPNE